MQDSGFGLFEIINLEKKVVLLFQSFMTHTVQCDCTVYNHSYLRLIPCILHIQKVLRTQFKTTISMLFTPIKNSALPEKLTFLNKF